MPLQIAATQVERRGDFNQKRKKFETAIVYEEADKDRSYLHPGTPRPPSG